LVLDEMLSDY